MNHCATSSPSAPPAADRSAELGQELTHERATRRAQGRAHRDLLVPAGILHQQQVGDVGAGDQQHEDDRARQEIDCSADITVEKAPERGHHAQRGRHERALTVADVDRACLHARPRILNRSIAREPGDGEHRTLARRAGGIEGQPELLAHGGELERRRHDADDFDDLVVEPDRAADHRPVRPEAAAPEPVAQQDHLPSLADIRSIDEAAELRRYGEGLQQVAADERAERLGGLVAANQHAAGEVEGVDRSEQIGPRLQELDLIGVEVAQRAGLGLGAEIDQSSRVPVGQRFQHQGVDDGVDRRRSADAEPEREHGDGRETGAREKPA